MLDVNLKFRAFNFVFSKSKTLMKYQNLILNL